MIKNNIYYNNEFSSIVKIYIVYYNIVFMRNFVLFSRLGRTDGNFNNLRDAGRLDIAAHCLTSSFFLSHALRKNVILYIVLTGKPKPPLCIKVTGSELYDVRCDEETWGKILKNVLSGNGHTGFEVYKKSFQELIKELADENEIYVLEEKGEEINNIKFKDNIAFVIGDHIGLPKKEEGFVLRYGKKISLGNKTYLAADCITILNYELDKN